MENLPPDLALKMCKKLPQASATAPCVLHVNNDNFLHILAPSPSQKQESNMDYCQKLLNDHRLSSHRKEHRDTSLRRKVYLSHSARGWPAALPPGPGIWAFHGQPRAVESGPWPQPPRCPPRGEGPPRSEVLLAWEPVQTCAEQPSCSRQAIDPLETNRTHMHQ